MFNDPKYQKLKDKIRRAVGIDEQYAILGDGSGVVNVVEKPGYVYARINQGNSYSAPIIARLITSTNVYEGASVVIATVGGEPSVIRGLAEYQLTQGAGGQGAAATQKGGFNAYDPTVISTLFHGTLEQALDVQADSPFSQTVVINGETYLADGTFNTYAGERLDMTSYYPAASKRCMAVLFLATDNTIEVQVSTDAELLDPPTAAEIQECIDAASTNAIPIYAINLVDGDDEIKPLSSIALQSCLWDDLRSINHRIVQAPITAQGFFDAFNVVSGNTIAGTVDTGQMYNGYWSQGTPANGNSVETSFYMAPGDYTLFTQGLTSANSGIIDWSIDGTNVITGQDWYSAGLTKNVLKNGSVTITGTGRHTLRLTINGKNASSGNYFWLLTRWYIK